MLLFDPTCCPPVVEWTVTCTLRPAFPLGPLVTWVSPSGQEFVATLLDGAVKYLLVGVDPDLAEVLMDDLEAMRRDLAAAAGWTVTVNEPKIGCVVATDDPTRPLRFRVRQNLVQGMHPGMAASGILMLAAAAGTAETVVADLLGGPAAGSLEVAIPGGTCRDFTVVPSPPDGLEITYGLSTVASVLLPPAAAAGEFEDIPLAG